MGHVAVGRRWERVAMDLLDMSISSAKGNRYVLVMVDCFSSRPYAFWVKDSLEVAFNQVRRHSGQAVRRQKRLYDQRAVRRLFVIGDWVMRNYPAGRSVK